MLDAEHRIGGIGANAEPVFILRMRLVSYVGCVWLANGQGLSPSGVLNRLRVVGAFGG